MRYGWAEALSRTGQFYSAIIGQFYPGVDNRHILSLRLDFRAEFRKKSSDIDSQIRLLNRGYMGLRMVETPAGFNISYGRSCN